MSDDLVTIRPLRGFGPFLFGQTKAEVERIIGSLYGADALADSAWRDTSRIYWKMGYHIDFGGNDKLVAIEMDLYRKMEFEKRAVLKGVDVFSIRFLEFLNLLLEARAPVEIDGGNLYCYALGIAAGIQKILDGEADTVDSIIVFCRGYYNGVRPWSL